MLLFGLILASTAQFCLGQTPPTASENFPHYIALDGPQNVWLFWKFTETHITLELNVKTLGWIGVGISSAGAMTGSDIFVGWVKNGKAFLTDRHATANAFPPKDTIENLELLEGSECNGRTVIKFRRQLAGCELTQDRPVTADTARIIYGYGLEDPTGEDIVASDYHGAVRRGSRSVILLESRVLRPVPANEQHQHFDLSNEGIQVPAVDTYYNCRLFKLPDFTKKHHIVRVEPIIQAGYEQNVHHIVVYQCLNAPQDLTVVGRNVQCYTANMPQDFRNCELVISAWHIGGGPMVYPNHAGYPIGTPDDPKYILMETHYDNPTLRSDIVDSSVMRFTYTENLRTFDAGVLEVGHKVDPYRLIIPPNAMSFLAPAECSSNCLTEALREQKFPDIKIFANFLHSHVVGRSLELKHIRNGVELPVITKDDSYDFNFQEARYLAEERVIKQGDSLQMVCNYRTIGKRTNVTIGGLSTSHEMCLSFVQYYPKLQISVCDSLPEINALMGTVGITNFTFTSTNGPYGSLADILVLAPPVMAGKTAEQVFNEKLWNEASVDEFSARVSSVTRQQFCKNNNHIPPNVNNLITPLVITTPHQPVVRQCTGQSTGFSPSVTQKTCGASFLNTSPKLAGVMLALVSWVLMS
ncbi:DBH-like monooxygenase protein 1 homolog [Ciona intestinalis]